MPDRSRSLARLQRRAGRLAETLGDWRGRWYATPVLGVGLLVGLVVLPLSLDVPVFGTRLGALVSPNILVVALLWATAAQSWNIVSGFSGQFSFGHAAFFGLGAYVPLVLSREFAVNPWLGMLAGSLLAAVYALCIGGLSFRYDVGGSYFALVTLAFAELLLYLFINVDQLGGASGFVKPFPDAYGAEYGLLAFQFRETVPYYYVALGLLLVVSLVALAIKRSRIGLYLFAIRDDEAAASAVGVPTIRYKLFALVVSAFFTAWAGTLWSMYFVSIRPRVVFGLLVNLDILLPAVVGGLGTIFGPIVGSLLLTVASEVARESVGIPELQDVVYGVVLLLVVLRTPGGVVTWPSRVAEALAIPQRESESEEPRGPPPAATEGPPTQGVDERRAESDGGRGDPAAGDPSEHDG